MLNYILYRIGQFIALAVPLKIAYTIAVIFSDLHYMFAFADRRAVTENLRTIFPEITDSKLRNMRLRMFRNFAKYLVDFFRFSKLNKKYITDHITVENIHYVDEALKKNKGVILLTAHLGNWELGGVVIALSGYPFWVVALPHKNKKVDVFFNRQRESKGIRVIPLGHAARQCFSLLKKNKILGLVGDRDFGEKGKRIAVDFFGKKSFLPLGPAALSLQTGAAIIPGFMLRNPDDTFTLKLNKPIEAVNFSSLLQIIDAYKPVIENYIREYPDQWYMFKRFWNGSK